MISSFFFYRVHLNEIFMGFSFFFNPQHLYSCHQRVALTAVKMLKVLFPLACYMSIFNAASIFWIEGRTQTFGHFLRIQKLCIRLVSYCPQKSKNKRSFNWESGSMLRNLMRVLLQMLWGWTLFLSELPKGLGEKLVIFHKNKARTHV